MPREIAPDSRSGIQIFVAQLVISYKASRHAFRRGEAHRRTFSGKAEPNSRGSAQGDGFTRRHLEFGIIIASLRPNVRLKASITI